MNIAIVDDLSSESDALRNILNDYAAINRLTFAIDVFPGGEDFLRSFSPFPYAVIFMDIYMTGIWAGHKTQVHHWRRSYPLFYFFNHICQRYMLIQCITTHNINRRIPPGISINYFNRSFVNFIFICV